MSITEVTNCKESLAQYKEDLMTYWDNMIGVDSIISPPLLSCRVRVFNGLMGISHEECLAIDTAAQRSTLVNLAEKYQSYPYATTVLSGQTGNAATGLHLLTFQLLSPKSSVKNEDFSSVNNWQLPLWTGLVGEGRYSLLGLDCLKFWGVKVDPNNGLCQ